jgi:DNA-binding LacI/PurR family transcriptional regulator
VPREPVKIKPPDHLCHRRDRATEHLTGIVPPNIYDVARETGVSIATVSHAFSGRGRVSPATRERILRVAEEIGYTANPHARNLVSGLSWTIAIQIAGMGTHSGSVMLPDAAYFMELLNGAASAAAEDGYALTLVPHDFNPRHGEGLAMDGAIIVDPAGGEPLASALSQRGLPVVTTGRPTRSPVEFPWVDNDHADTTLRMMRHFTDMGYQWPALVATTPTRSYVADIVDAYRRWCAQAGVRPRIVELGEPPSEKAAARATRRLLLENNPPDAIYATYERLALGVMREAEHLGIAIPADLGLASAVDGEMLTRVSPAVTGVSNNARSIGRIAVELLVGLLAGGGRAWSGVVVSNRLVPRASTARQPSAHTMEP